MDILNSNLIIIVLLALALVVSSVCLYKVIVLRSKLSFLFDDSAPRDLEGRVLLALKQVDEALNTSDIIKRRLRVIQKKLESSITRKVLKRYNPFHDTGSNQSFSLCLLDSNHNGVIISGLYSRGQTNLYSKEVSEGKPLNNLSDEEQEVLNESLID